MWMSGLDRAVQWYDWLLVFARGDPFERFVVQPAKTSRVELVAGVVMIVSVVAAAAGILARILL